MRVPKVVVAIDFGTHGTGFAFTLVSSDNDDPRKRRVYSRQEWPKAPGRGVKDLSALVIDRDLQPVAWGYEAYELWRLNTPYKREELGLCGYAYAFKMALSSRAENRAVARAEGAVDFASSRMLRRLIASTLRYTREHALAEMRSLDVGLTELDIRWCITVPAIWSDAQKEIMRQAAEDAGLDAADRVVIAIEPEAAAVYGILNAGRWSASPALSNGAEQRLMVVDCGGGTIDISAFGSTVEGARVQLAEIGGGSTGGALGSQYVNHAFRTRLLPRRLGEILVEQLEEEHGDLLSELENQWERAKQHVGVSIGDDGRPQVAGPVYLNLTPLWPLLPEGVRHRLITEADDEPRTLFLTPEEVQALFDGVVDPIVALVRRAFDELRTHVSGAPITVLLVGGFAVNDYLRARIGRELEGEATVLRPTDPREAVLHGAVHFCYEPRLIRQRRARLTYGFQMALPYRPGTDDMRHEIIMGPDEQKLCRDRFQVAVRRSQAVELDQPYHKVLTPASAATPELRVTFLASRDRDPQYINDEGVARLGEIVIDIRSTVGRPPADRQVMLDLVFGDTTIAATATALDTGARYDLELPFQAQHDDPTQAEALDLV